MTEPNEITVAVCVYNGAKYIADTLACISGQSFQAFDLLIVNDCSTDETVRIVSDYFDKTPRDYRLIDLPENGGVAHARQVALERAATRYLLFIDADDLPHPTLVEREYLTISTDENMMAVSCWSEYIDAAGKKVAGGLFLGSKTGEEFISRASMGKLVFLPVQTMFDRRAALQVGGFRLDGFPGGRPRYRDFCEDLDLWTRMSDLYSQGKYIVTIPSVLYSYRKSDGGLSSNTMIMLLKMKYVKANLRLRRAGKPEQTFIDFFGAMSEKDKKSLEKEALAADCLRNGVFFLKRGSPVKGAVNIIKSVYYKPSYLLQKVKHNSGLFKKK